MRCDAASAVAYVLCDQEELRGWRGVCRLVATAAANVVPSLAALLTLALPSRRPLVVRTVL